MHLGTGLSPVSTRLHSQSSSNIDPLAVKLLLHFDSDFSDSSLFKKIGTVNGSPAIDSVVKVFGAGSISKTASQSIDFPAGTDWNIADAIPWQLSFRLFSATGRLSTEFFFGTNNWVGAGWSVRASGWTSFQLISNGGVKASWNYTFPVDTWTAHRFNYDGAGNYRWYVDGVLLGVVNSTSVVDNSGGFRVGGRPGAGDGITGNLDEVKWEKSADLVITTSATYDIETSSFADPLPLGPPPANPASMAKLLLHFDSGFSDSSTANRVPILTGAPTIDTVNKVFGAGSMVKTSIQSVSYPASTDWFIADAIPWQLSFRVFSATGRLASETFFANAGWAPGFIFRFQNGSLELASNGGSRASWNYSLPFEVWTAHRINHDGFGNYRWYVDGILLGVKTPGGIVDTTAALNVGRRPDIFDGFTGNMDEIKWEKDPNLSITIATSYTLESGVFPDP